MQTFRSRDQDVRHLSVLGGFVSRVRVPCANRNLERVSESKERTFCGLLDLFGKRTDRTDPNQLKALFGVRAISASMGSKRE